MSNRTDLSNIFINFLKKKRYERLIAEGQLQDNQFYAVTDGSEKTEYGDLFGNIENQTDLYNALYASRLFKMEMCNDVRGYDIVHKLYDRREFDLSKFTVVGNPVISEDGIASGFSSQPNNINYLTIPTIQLGQVDNWKIHISFNTSDLFNLPAEWIFVTSHASFFGGISLGIESGANLRIRLASTASSIGDLVDKSFIKIIKPNTKYEVIVEFTGTTYNISYKIDNNEWVIYTTQSTTKLYNDLNSFRLGYRSSYSVEEGFSGSIDLKQFSITVDGKEVFNGLKDLTQYDTYTLPSSEVITIPYIPSVDGVKIVDVAYKPLVDQLYTETGMGNYIIIDEVNKTFRLPLPDIYSQIENKTSFTLRKWED